MNKEFQSFIRVFLRIGKGNKTSVSRRMRRRILATALSVCMVFTLLPMQTFSAVTARGTAGLCEHHTLHTEECGFTEGTKSTPCTHEHGADCFKPVKNCIHEHTAECYDTNEEIATSSGAAKPVKCPHVCSGENGCITEEPDCIHEQGKHDDSCGYTAGTKGKPCTFVCGSCNQTPEQPDGLPAIPDELPAIPEQKCICTELCTAKAQDDKCPVCAGDWNKCAYEADLETVTETEAMLKVYTLITALPTMDELNAVDPGGEDFSAYIKTLRTDTAQARTAYESLTDKEKTAFDTAALEKLEAVEAVLAAFPALMAAEGIPVLDAEGYYQNVKYTLDSPSAGKATVSGVKDSSAILGEDNDLTIPEQVQKDNKTYTVTAIASNAFSSSNELTVVTVPESVTSIGSQAFYKMQPRTAVMLQHTGTLPEEITPNSFYTSESPLYVVIADEAAAASLMERVSGSSKMEGRRSSAERAKGADSSKKEREADSSSAFMILNEVPSATGFDKQNTAGTLKVKSASSSGRYDVVGLKDGSEIKTTYGGYGYSTYLSTNAVPTSSNSTLVNLPGEGVESLVANGIWAAAATEFVSSEKYLRVTYTLRNSTDAEISSISLGVDADVQIGGDDSASIYPTATGFRMVNTKNADWDPLGSGMQFTLNCLNAPGADNVDTMWYGKYSDRGSNRFIDLPSKTDLTGLDSGLAFSWKNMTIPAKGTITRSVLFGVGEDAAPPKLPEAGQKPIALYLTATGEKKITVNAKVTDAPGVTDTLYYTINEGPEQTLGTVNANGSEKVIAGVIGEENFVNNGQYIVKLWVMNSKGAMSEVITKTITVNGDSISGDGLESGTAPVAPGQEEPEVPSVPSGTAPGGVVTAPLTQEKVEQVFGEGNATVDTSTTPNTIHIKDDIIVNSPIIIKPQPIIIDLGGSTVTGDTGVNPVIKVDGGGSTTITGGGSITGGTGAGGTGSGGNSGSGGAGVEVGGGSTVIIGGGTEINGGDSSTGNGGDGITGDGNVVIGGDTGAESGGGSANGGNSGGSSGNGGGGVNVGGDITIGSGSSASGGDGSGSGNGGNGADSDGGSITIGSGGSASGGDGGTNPGGTGGNGGDGAATGGVITIDSGASSNGGNGGSGSAGGGTGGNGTDTTGSSTIVNGDASGGNGGSATTDGNGGNGGSGSHTGSGGIVTGGGTLTGGNGGNGTGSGAGGGSGTGSGIGGAGGPGVSGGSANGPTVINGSNGLSTTIKIGGSAGGSVTVPDKKQLVNAVLTQEEKNDPSITDVKVILTVEKKENQPDKAQIENALKASGTAADTIGAYFDIGLEKTITKNGQDASKPIYEAEQDVDITITIPADMQGGSNYVVIRVHNGVGEALATTQSGNSLTFQTDKFSTYAIAYSRSGSEPVLPAPPTHSSGGSSSSGESSGITITLPPEGNPSAPIQAIIAVDGTVGENGSAAASITEKVITDAINKAQNTAQRKGISANGVALTINVNTGGKAAGSITINLPKAVQEKVINEKIVNTMITVSQPSVMIGINLEAMTEINRQAKADASLTATLLDSSQFMGAAKETIGMRPAFDLKLSYGNGIQIQNLNTCNLTAAVPYILQEGETAENIQAVSIDAAGNVTPVTGSVYDINTKCLLYASNSLSTFGVGYRQGAFPAQN